LDVYVLDTRAGTVKQWVRSVYGSVDPGELADPELIRWESFDGLKIPGFLYRPPPKFTGRRPVMIDIHGGPLEQYRPEYSYTHNYFVNELGVAVIYPNVRGSKGYGKRYASLDDGLRRGDAVKDVGSLLDWIKAQPDLDADRVLVRGASYGGYVALSVAANYGQRIRAVVSDSGISNLTSAVGQNEGWDRELQRAEFGDERDPKVKEFFEKAAPANNAAKIKVPLLVIHGARDARVKIGEAERMIQAARKHGRPAWFLIGKNEGHGFTRRSSHDYRMYAEILFAKEFLLK
ncbi:MAG: alpha/beta fold hydrolase, partial [Acidobacteriota bacterium]|nr:alpha/beta fold hydrolase [Acidobacteriota bacterium]